MTDVVAALKLLNHVLKGETQILFVAEPVRRFPRQARLIGRGSCSRFVLLCLDGLAFPAPSHRIIIAFPDGSFFPSALEAREVAMCAVPSWEKFVRKTDLQRKSDITPEIWGYNAASLLCNWAARF
jgi:hypothetical protein